MKLEKIAGFPAISSDAFLVIYDLGQELLNEKTNEVQKFWVNCRRFLDELIRDVVSHRKATSGVSRGLYSFCPEILLEGDNNSIFGLFAGLCKILVDCVALPLGFSNAAVDDFYSFVVEKRRHYAGCEQSTN